MCVPYLEFSLKIKIVVITRINICKKEKFLPVCHGMSEKKIFCKSNRKRLFNIFSGIKTNTTPKIKLADKDHGHSEALNSTFEAHVLSQIVKKCCFE